MKDFNLNTDEIIKISEGVFISKKDPLFWEKIKKFKPNNYEVLSYLSKRKYEEALETYNKAKTNSNFPKYTSIFIQQINEALLFHNKAHQNKLISDAFHRDKILSLKNNFLSERNQTINVRSKKLKKLLYTAIILFLIYLLFFPLFLYADSNEKFNHFFSHTFDFSSHNKKEDLIQEHQSFESNNHFIYIEHNTSQQKVRKRINEYVSNNGLNQQKEFSVTAVHETPTGLNVILKAQKNENHPSLAFTNQTTSIHSNNETYSSLTILRSALYFFVENKGYFPETLSELTQSFPNNYLSYIPFDEEGENRISNTFTAQGGWVYEKPSEVIVSKIEKSFLTSVVENAVISNSADTCNAKNPCAFYPVEIHIQQNSHDLFLVSGPVVLDTFNVGLGKNNSTPNGEFYIQKRVAFPNYHLPTSTHPFGTRGLELSDETYAIHGTFEQDSINENFSKGCVRLTNSDVERLFAKTPLFTPVTIQPNGSINPAYSQTNPPNIPNKEKISDTPFQPTDINSGNKKFTSVNGNNTGNGSGNGNGDDNGSGNGNGSGDGGGKGDGDDIKSETDPSTIYHWAG